MDTLFTVKLDLIEDGCFNFSVTNASLVCLTR